MKMQTTARDVALLLLLWCTVVVLCGRGVRESMGGGGSDQWAVDRKHFISFSQAVTPDQLECIHEAGYDWPIFQLYANGSVDPNWQTNWQAVNDNPLYRLSVSNPIDLFLVPCALCNKSPQQQIEEAVLQYTESWNVTYLSHGGTDLSPATAMTLWIVVENTQNWKSDPQSNIAWLAQMLNDTSLVVQSSEYGLIGYGDQWYMYNPTVLLGIRTSAADWQSITGGTKQFSRFPLWYTNPGSPGTMQDFEPFGGWGTSRYAGGYGSSSGGYAPQQRQSYPAPTPTPYYERESFLPLMKTYNSDQDVCGVVGDQVYYMKVYPPHHG